jgi:hypothetical protein
MPIRVSTARHSSIKVLEVVKNYLSARNRNVKDSLGVTSGVCPQCLGGMSAYIGSFSGITLKSFSLAGGKTERMVRESTLDIA